MATPKSNTKRKRVVKSRPSSDSCSSCMSRKIKCNGRLGETCQGCKRRGVKCEYRSWTVTLAEEPPPLFDECIIAEPSLTTDPHLDSPSDEMDIAKYDEMDIRCQSVQICDIPRLNREAVIDYNTTLSLEYFIRQSYNFMACKGPDFNYRKLYMDAAVDLAIKEPMLRYALAAIGNVHRSTIRAFDMNLRRPVVSDDMTLDLYNKALTHLHRALDRASQDHKPTAAILTCCWILSALSLYTGKDIDAAKHSDFGRRIMRSHLESDPPGSGSDNALELAASVFFPVGPPFRPSDGMPANLIVGDSSTTANDARVTLDAMIVEGDALLADITEVAERLANCKLGNRGVASARRHCYVRCLSRMVDIDNDTQTRLNKVASAHKAWMRWFLERLPQVPRWSMVILMLRFLLSYFNLATCRDTTEMASDAFETEFVHALGLVDANLGYGSVPILLLICIKCRNHDIRRKAATRLRDILVELDSAASQLITNFANGVIDLEMDRAANFRLEPQNVRSYPSPPLSESNMEEVPMDARFSEILISQDSNAKAAGKIVCGRFAHERNGEIEILEYHRDLNVPSGWHVKHVDPLNDEVAEERANAATPDLITFMMLRSRVTLWELSDWSPDLGTTGLHYKLFQEACR